MPCKNPFEPLCKWLSARITTDRVFASVGLFISIVSIVLSVQSLTLTQKALEQNNLATIYSLSQSSHEFITLNPSVAKHFDRNYRFNGETDKKLMDEFHMGNDQNKIAIWHGCEKLSDFIQLTFNQRYLIPKEDWETWWNYFLDLYQESPVLREFLKTRKNWYSFEDKTASGLTAHEVIARD